jgi:Ser/Thr protein kinase RdoA (MazF antagonist)
VDEDLLAFARTAFGWHGDIEVIAGPRGALGQIWQVRVASARYALKEIFAEPPTEASIAVERELCSRAGDAGVSVPATHPDSAGQYLLDAPGGRWVRCYDWLDLRPVDIGATDTPRQLGTLLARLHRCATPMVVEPVGGGPPDPWYDRVPPLEEWTKLARSNAPWAPRLARRLSTLTPLCAAVAPVDPAKLVVCHRDLHPENVFTGPGGALVVVDWDDLGPAESAQELTKALVEWFWDGHTLDVHGARTAFRWYVREGGPGSVAEPRDFSLLLATRLNFLLSQAVVAIDDNAERRHRDWAELEVDRGLQLLPTERVLAEVLDATRAGSVG